MRLQSLEDDKGRKPWRIWKAVSIRCVGFAVAGIIVVVVVEVGLGIFFVTIYLL